MFLPHNKHFEDIQKFEYVWKLWSQGRNLVHKHNTTSSALELRNRQDVVSFRIFFIPFHIPILFRNVRTHFIIIYNSLHAMCKFLQNISFQIQQSKLEFAPWISGNSRFQIFFSGKIFWKKNFFREFATLVKIVMEDDDNTEPNTPFSVPEFSSRTSEFSKLLRLTYIP